MSGFIRFFVTSEKASSEEVNIQMWWGLGRWRQKDANYLEKHRSLHRPILNQEYFKKYLHIRSLIHLLVVVTFVNPSTAPWLAMNTQDALVFSNPTKYQTNPTQKIFKTCYSTCK
ncbi:hypothetical protein KT99_14435 [Shewanella benthica KT99]|uniref:Uncharacterized protein n=1 Tax=Shewanella benthica KT99 TaxID=314608 RepID=A9DLN6_9GAMM|nr:hypothetical protein KT99_14435 [Shewanella benthica KT99]